MLKETIKYTDYDGNEREEDFYFNLSKAEVVEMEMSTAGGMEKMIQNIIASQDSARIVEVFKEIVKKAYGVKSADGRRFIKGPEITDSFVQTEAYSDLFIHLASDADYAARFIRGILPVVENQPKAIENSDVVVSVK